MVTLATFVKLLRWRKPRLLPDDYLTTLCSDIAGIGIKANENIQKLGRWLEMGITVALRNTKDGIEEALDLIDAYGENFHQKILEKCINNRQSACCVRGASCKI